MNRFGFLAENIRPLGSKDNMFRDCLMTQTEKRAMFGGKLSAAQKEHQKKVKEVGKLRKQGLSMAEAWAVVKSGKKTVPKSRGRKNTVPKKRKTTRKNTVPKRKSTTTRKTVPKRKTVSKSTTGLTPAQKRAKRAMKLAHQKYGGDLKRAWAEIKKA